MIKMINDIDDNGDKFLKKLVFDNGISTEWSRNTIIGLIKSPYCKFFFDEQDTYIIDQARIEEFINMSNYVQHCVILRT